MKKILLVCAAGMSTSLLVNKMNDAASEQGVEVSITALPYTDARKELKEHDVIMVAPQVRFQMKDIQKALDGYSMPVFICDMKQYGRCDGPGLLKAAFDAMEEHA